MELSNLNANYPDKIIIEGKKRLSMTGVESVDGFTEQYLKLSVNGAKVLVSGQNIKITAYNKSSGSLSADGLFREIKYNVKHKSFAGRIFG